MQVAEMNLAVGAQVGCVFGAVPEDEEPEIVATTIVAVQGDSFLLESAGQFLGRGFLTSTGQMRCMSTMAYGEVYNRTRQKAAQMLSFSI